MSDNKTGLHIFTRDLRIIDNNSLNILAKKCSKTYTIFIFTPEQVSDKNKLASKNAIQFMIESLENLDDMLKMHGGKLHLFYGDYMEIVKYLVDLLSITNISINYDITPYAKKRQTHLQDFAEKQGIEFHSNNDYYLVSEKIETTDGKIFKKFTPFYNAAVGCPIDKPHTCKQNFTSLSGKKVEFMIWFSDAKKFTSENKNVYVCGGRSEGLSHLRTAVKSQVNYKNTRNTLATQTSMLGPYIKFGCLSIREVYFAFIKNKEFLRQLYWRDFYMRLLEWYPHILTRPLKVKYEKIKWDVNTSLFNAWKDGKTGFPIVDACMRQLNKTGWMHNRGRLIVASFLVKTLCLDWRLGEHYFAKQLIDYDVANNTGNWGWVSGSGADAQPYFRIFNPYTQGKTFDYDCIFIKTWVPELETVPPKDIHKWNERWPKYKIDYPAPIVDYKKQKEHALKLFSMAYM